MGRTVCGKCWMPIGECECKPHWTADYIQANGGLDAVCLEHRETPTMKRLLADASRMLAEYVGSPPATDDDWTEEHGLIAEIDEVLGRIEAGS